MSAVLNCQNCSERFDAKRSDARWCPPCRESLARERRKGYQLKRKDECPECGGQKVVGTKLCLPCENKRRRGAYLGQSNPHWKEGRVKQDGYVYVRVKEGKPGPGRGAFYRAEHILVWQEVHGKELPQGWVVHHLNGVKDDNRPTNLLGLPRHEHHQHPREALKPYEARILELEQTIAFMTGDTGVVLPPKSVRTIESVHIHKH